MGSLVPKPEPFTVTGTVSGNEARFIPQNGLLFRRADTLGWAQTEVLILRGQRRLVTAYVMK